MRKLATIAALAASCTLFSTPALAGTPYVEEMTCPVGGETFSHTATGSYSTWGSRPDGKPYGSWIFPMPIPECPTNRLVVFRDFEEEEIAELTALIESDEYKALYGETTYYRAQWLADRLTNETPEPWLLMRAVWQTDEAAGKRPDYLAEFADRAGALPLEPADFDLVYLRFLTANAYRELSRFDEALATLDTIPLASLPQDDNDWIWLVERIGLLAEVIRLEDTSAEPLRLIPSDIAAWQCDDWKQKGKQDIDPYCATLAQKRAEVESAEDRMEATADAMETEADFLEEEAAAVEVTAEIEANREASADAMEDAGAAIEEVESS